MVDTVGLKEDFARTWREHVVAPGSLLEEAMLEAVGLHRMRTTPPQGMKGAWKRLRPGSRIHGSCVGIRGRGA